MCECCCYIRPNCLLFNVHRSFSTCIFKKKITFKSLKVTLVNIFREGRERKRFGRTVEGKGFKSLGERIASNEGKEEEE